MDNNYDLHDTYEEFDLTIDKVSSDLKQAKAQYDELSGIKEKKEEGLRKEYAEAEGSLSRLVDNYRKTNDIAEKKDIYKQQRPFQQKLLTRFTREMKEDGDEFRLYTLYRPVHEIKL
jgi:geranylgeranyl pyrophosphate synthase